MRCTMYPINDKFQSLSENVIFYKEIHMSFFQLDHEIVTNLYLTKVTALRHSKKSSSFDISKYMFQDLRLVP